MVGFHAHDHDHDHHGHDHHGHGHGSAAPAGPRWRRFAIAGVVLGAAILAACSVTVVAGGAVVITRFGDPVRVLTEPGLHWKLPAPIETGVPVDLRLRTTSSGLLDVGTKDGLRVLVQAYVAWRVPADEGAIRQFLRGVRNDPDQAASQLRTFLGSAVEVTASNFELGSLLNTDPSQVRLDAYEADLKDRLAGAAAKAYGVTLAQVGVERLTLPAATLDATMERMRAERETAAAERMAAGRRQAAEISSNAQRDSRILRAEAERTAADLVAQSRTEAARIFGEAYQADPQLYTLLRSLDTLDHVVTGNTRLILRTDSAPFKILSDGPDGAKP